MLFYTELTQLADKLLGKSNFIAYRVIDKTIQANIMLFNKRSECFIVTVRFLRHLTMLLDIRLCRLPFRTKNCNMYAITFLCYRMVLYLILQLNA